MDCPADTSEEKRILNFITMAVESLETATRLVRTRQSSMHIVIGILGYAAIPAACGLLRLHGVAITSNTEPHAEMCERIAELERTGLAPKGAAATLRAIEDRYYEMSAGTHERERRKLLPLIAHLADRIEGFDPTGRRISRAVEDLVLAITVHDLQAKTAVHRMTRKKAKHW